MKLLWSKATRLESLHLDVSFMHILDFLSTMPTDLPCLKKVMIRAKNHTPRSNIEETCYEALESFLERIPRYSAFSLIMSGWEPENYSFLTNVLLPKLDALNIEVHTSTPFQWHAFDFIIRHASSISSLTLHIRLPTAYHSPTESIISIPSYVAPQQNLPQMILKSLRIQTFENQGRNFGAMIEDMNQLAIGLCSISKHTITRLELVFYLSTTVIQELAHAIGHLNNLRVLLITPWSINPQLLQSLADSLPHIRELVLNCVQRIIGDSAKEHGEVQKILARDHYIDPVSTKSPVVC
jgi:hypothetical protein